MTASSPAQIFIADDDSVLRALLRELFSREPDLAVSGEAATGIDALSQLQELHSSHRCPDIVLVDLNMPHVTGADFAAMRDACPGARLIVYSGEDEQVVRRMLSVEGLEYVVKGDPELLLAALRRAPAASDSVV